MTNLIQIKRSATAAIPTSLANGELAFTSNGDILYIGSPNGSIVSIGGARFPGTLTANQALVANSTSGINEIRVGTANVGAIYANGSLGTSGQALFSNSTGVYWGNVPVPVTGANTQIQFNDSGVLAADSDFTFNKDTNTLTVGTGTVNSTNFSGTANNATNLGGLSAASYQTTAGLAANVATLAANSATFLGNSSGTIANVASWITGNSATAYTNATSYADTVAGAAYANAVANAAALYQTTAGLSANVATLTANNSTNLGGQAAAFYTNATNLATGTVPTARLGSGTANGQSFLSGDQSYKTAVTSVSSGAGLSGGPILTTGTLSVQAADGIVANSGGVYVQAGTGVTVNSTGVHIGQAVGTGSSVSFANVVTSNLTVSASVSSNLMPSANNTYHLGNTTIKWAQVHAANVHGVTGIFDGNVEVSGDLIVTGNLVTTNVSSLIVGDAKILLAANNPGDLLDIGFSGTYTDGGSTVRHAGLFRDASDNGVFKFFANTTQNLTGNNVIDTGATGYTTAILDTYLKSGALSTNATVVSITANSTVNVAIVANTLTLTTGLAGTSGGTGRTTIANNAILVGNSTNGYNALALGTAGHVLQSNGTALIYNSLDGGSF